MESKISPVIVAPRTPAWGRRRTRAWCALVAETLEADPVCGMRVVREQLNRWRSSMDPRSRTYMDIVDNAAQNLSSYLALLCANGEHADVLRTCAATAGVVPERIRREFIRSWSSRSVPADSVPDLDAQDVKEWLEVFHETI